MNDMRLCEIYQNQAETYDALVSHEDFRGKLLPTLQEITPLRNKTIAEFGAGTGRITRLLNLQAKQVIAADHSSAMLQVARKRLSETGTENWSLVSADHREMPLLSASVELVIAGWTFGSFVDEDPLNWVQSLRAAITEVQRILQSGGICIIIETLGTCERFPSHPIRIWQIITIGWKAKKAFSIAGFALTINSMIYAKQLSSLVSSLVKRWQSE